MLGPDLRFLSLLGSSSLRFRMGYLAANSRAWVISRLFINHAVPHCPCGRRDQSRSILSGIIQIVRTTGRRRLGDSMRPSRTYFWPWGDAKPWATHGRPREIAKGQDQRGPILSTKAEREEKCGLSPVIRARGVQEIIAILS